MPSVEPSSLEDGSAESLTDAANSQTGEPCRTGPAAWPTQNKASEPSQEAVGARAKVGSRRKEKGEERGGL
jgi:hypothetical protein